MKQVYYVIEDQAAVQDFYADVIGKGLEKQVILSMKLSQ